MNSAEKEAVLHCLKSMIDEAVCEECPLYGTTGTDHCENDCVRLAINALEQEPREDVPDNNVGEMDCISRELALEKMADYVASGYADSAEDFEEYSKIICQLPPVTTEKVGQWEWNQYDSNPKIGNFHCSQCHGIGKSYYDYCPSCGAKMQEVEE